MAIVHNKARREVNPDTHIDSGENATAYRQVAVASGVAFPACRALMVGTPGTADVTDLAGNILLAYPLQAGQNNMRATKITLNGTAANVWAMY